MQFLTLQWAVGHQVSGGKLNTAIQRISPFHIHTHSPSHVSYLIHIAYHIHYIHAHNAFVLSQTSPDCDQNNVRKTLHNTKHVVHCSITSIRTILNSLYSRFYLCRNWRKLVMVCTSAILKHKRFVPVYSYKSYSQFIHML